MGCPIFVIPGLKIPHARNSIAKSEYNPLQPSVHSSPLINYSALLACIGHRHHCACATIRSKSSVGYRRARKIQISHESRERARAGIVYYVRREEKFLLPWNIYYFSSHRGWKCHISVSEPGGNEALSARCEEKHFSTMAFLRSRPPRWCCTPEWENDRVSSISTVVFFFMPDFLYNLINWKPKLVDPLFWFILLFFYLTLFVK